MLHRLYVNNFKTLQNFDLPLPNTHSVLLVGDNGSGKSSVRRAIEILQLAARGTNRTGKLVKPRDFSFGRSDAPMRFELDVQLGKDRFLYYLALELPVGFHEVRVLEEGLNVNGDPIYEREVAQVSLNRNRPSQGAADAASFLIDWHQIALPLIQQSKDEPLFRFREWLARSVVLNPVPSLARSESQHETLEPSPDASDLAAWFSGVVAYAPAAYQSIHSYLSGVMPDLEDIRNPPSGAESRTLSVRFRRDKEILTVPFEDLSDGEKCFMICAVVLAADKAYGPLLCFWDEPDNHLSLSEVDTFVTTLRKTFHHAGQWIATSHHPLTLSAFSQESTLVLSRNSHLEPTVVRQLSSIDFHGDPVRAMMRGEIR